MCNACVIDGIKKRMLSQRTLSERGQSRRQFLQGSAAAGVAATATAAGLAAYAPITHAMGHGGVTDMTHELHEAFPTYFGDQQFFSDQTFNYAEHKFNLLELRVNEHTGTHMDAPLHFSEDGQSVAEIPVSSLVVPLCVIDIRKKAADNADAQVTPDDLKAWMSEHGDIPDNACVAMLSGWGDYVDSEKFRGADDKGMHFPGFHVDAAQMLIEETGTIGMAVDTLSLDHGPSGDFATHYAWLPTNRWGIENLANLDQVPASGATLIVGAPKHRGGTGGPARIFAMM